MKKLLSIIILGLFFIILGCEKDSLFDEPDFKGDTSVILRGIGDQFPPEVEEAIISGIEWLLTTQNTNGNFGGSADGVARTALAVTKLCDRSIEIEPGTPPMEGPYGTEIGMGLNYIFEYAVNNPEGGIYLSNSMHHSVYNTGIAMMALTAVNCPTCVVAVPGSVANGMPYEAVLQATLDFFINAQNPDGGWRYYDHSAVSDNSNTGFAVLGLLAAEGAGFAIPQNLKDNLSIYIDYIQNDGSGGSGYVDPNSWVNIMKTGNLLFEMAFVGDASETDRVQAALGYIETNWNMTGDVGWKTDNYLAMYCLMKGFVSMGIETINVGGIETDWYNEMVEEILNSPHWPLPGDPWLDPYLSSTFSLLTLEKITPIPYKEVSFDIKPTSCPNPFNMGANGVLPVAILGSEEFDVGSINVASILLHGVAPIRSDYEDVSAPVVDAVEACECTTAGPDGYVDLTLKFERQDIAAALGEVNDGDAIELTIEGETEDGIAIIGSDCIVIKKKGKK